MLCLIIHGQEGMIFTINTIGNWDQYRGPSALTTVEKYQEKSGFSKTVVWWILLSCDQAKVTLFLGLIEFVIKGLGGRVVELKAVLLGVIHLFSGIIQNSFTQRVRLMMHWLIRWCYLVRGI